MDKTKDHIQLESLMAQTDLGDYFEHWQAMDKSVITFEKGEIIYTLGSRISSLYFMLNGLVELDFYNDQGDIMNITTIQPITVLGEVEYILNCPTLTEATAIAKTVCIEIPIVMNQKYLETDVTFSRFLNQDLALKMTAISHVAIDRRLVSTQTRLAVYILRRGYTEGSEITGLGQIAKTINCSYRQLLRSFKALSDKKLLSHGEKKGVYYLENLSGLEQLVREDNL